MNGKTADQFFQFIIAPLLAKGKQNATPTAVLAARTGMTPREIRQHVHEERRAGALIGSSMGTPSGYFLFADEGEAADCARTLERHAKATFSAAAAARKFSRRNPNQERLPIKTEATP